MKRVRLTDELDTWGQTWPAGTEFQVHQALGWSWEVIFPTRDGKPVVGTVTKRIAEEVVE